MAKGIFVSAKIKGTPMSFTSLVELENGMVIERGAVVTDKPLIYNAIAPTGTGEVYVVGDPAWSYDNSGKTNQNEDEYVIKAGKTFRAYPLDGKGNPDRFTVADYGIDNGGSIAVGGYVGSQAGSNKLLYSSTLPASGFAGKVVEVKTQGCAYFVGQTVDTQVKLVTVEVVKNG